MHTTQKKTKNRCKKSWMRTETQNDHSEIKTANKKIANQSQRCKLTTRSNTTQNKRKITEQRNNWLNGQNNSTKMKNSHGEMLNN